MNKKFVIIVITLILISIGLCGCNEDNAIDDTELIVGTWKDPMFPNDSFIFLSNGTGSWTNDSMLWEIKDGKLNITIQSSGTEITYEYTFSDNNQTLTLTYVDLANIRLTLVKQ